MRILHAIHDFLPRHAAGSELYAFHLCRELAQRNEVHVLCAEYDPGRPDGEITYRSFGGLHVVELVNNWGFTALSDSYRSPHLNRQLGRILDEVRPDVLHIHNLLNLSFDLPGLARARGVPSVATLHDFTLVCPSGGQRVHLAEEHVCVDIDPERCSRCFGQSPFYRQMAFGAGHHAPSRLMRVVKAAGRMLPTRTGPNGGVAPTVTREDITRRLQYLRRSVVDVVDLFVAPSQSLAADYLRFGIPAGKIRVSDYGFVPFRETAPPPGDRLRIGFVGTLVWHKGVHVLVEAARLLPASRFELLLFGDPLTFPDYMAALQRRAEGLPVRFMGAFANENARDVYAQMHVLVVPSLWPENSPLVIHEAFMAGVPVVGSNMGGIPGLLWDGAGGLVYEAFSPEALAAVLRGLMDQPERLRRLAERRPAVKTIADDGLGWESLYGSMTARQRKGATA